MIITLLLLSSLASYALAAEFPVSFINLEDEVIVFQVKKDMFDPFKQDRLALLRMKYPWENMLRNCRSYSKKAPREQRDYNFVTGPICLNPDESHLGLALRHSVMDRFVMCILSQEYAQRFDEACDDSVGFCTYQCHCEQGCVNEAGFCNNGSKCKKGWFGIRCQYYDLVTSEDANLKMDVPLDISWMTDRNDSTCNTIPSFRYNVTVNWNKTYPLTWVRIVLQDESMLSTLKLQYNERQECQNQTYMLLKPRTLDIRCNDNVVMQNLTLLGNITTLCSYYISGGRNIAFKQNASQSSDYNYRFLASLAVDGNSDTFSATKGNDSNPSFNLQLQTSYMINRIVLFNRKQYSDRLKGFRLTYKNALGEVVGSYRDKTEAAQQVYYVNVAFNSPISSIFVNDTIKIKSDFFKVPMVTLCEIQAFGECPAGKWGLPCTKSCHQSCPDSCHMDNGQCHSACVGYKDPPQCRQACTQGHWGINCSQVCSNRCAKESCNTTTGVCNMGCLGYSDPPLCLDACPGDKWGVNCNQSCSIHCISKNCSSVNGECYLGCTEGYQPPGCNQECSLTTWGVNCSHLCSSHCRTSSCHSTNSTCDDGCKDGCLPPDCTQEMRFCNWQAFAIGVAVGVAALILLNVIIVTCFLYRRHRRKRFAERADNHGYDNVYGNSQYCHGCEVSQCTPQCDQNTYEMIQH